MPKNKLIKCINDKCTEQYADLFYKLEGKYEYCPYDYTKDKYIHLTLDEFKDVNDEAFNLELMYTSGSDGNIKIECKQLSPHMKIVGADGDTDTPIMIGGFIIYDLENKFMI